MMPRVYEHVRMQPKSNYGIGCVHPSIVSDSFAYGKAFDVLVAGIACLSILGCHCLQQAVRLSLFAGPGLCSSLSSRNTAVEMTFIGKQSLTATKLTATAVHI